MTTPITITISNPTALQRIVEKTITDSISHITEANFEALLSTLITEQKDQTFSMSRAQIAGFLGAPTPSAGKVEAQIDALWGFLSAHTTANPPKVARQINTGVFENQNATDILLGVLQREQSGFKLKLTAKQIDSAITALIRVQLSEILTRSSDDQELLRVLAEAITEDNPITRDFRSFSEFEARSSEPRIQDLDELLEALTEAGFPPEYL